MFFVLLLDNISAIICMLGKQSFLKTKFWHHMCVSNQRAQLRRTKHVCILYLITDKSCSKDPVASH